MHRQNHFIGQCRLTATTGCNGKIDIINSNLKYQGRKEAASYRTHSATLPLSEPLPTTTTGHYTVCCKKSQSCAPEDGQKFARNVLSWSWRSINCCCCISLVFCITLPSYQVFVPPLIFSDRKVNAYFRSLRVVLVPWVRQYFCICTFYLMIFTPLNIWPRIL